RGVYHSTQKDMGRTLALRLFFQIVASWSYACANGLDRAPQHLLLRIVSTPIMQPLGSVGHGLGSKMQALWPHLSGCHGFRQMPSRNRNVSTYTIMLGAISAQH